MWFRFRKLSPGYFFSNCMRFDVYRVSLFIFIFNLDVRNIHMLWAMPLAFFASSVVFSAPYVKWRVATLRKKHGLD